VTTQAKKRCTHCGAFYVYTGSGHGCLEPTNDPHWCSLCKRAVLDTLAQIPRHFECRYRNIAEMPERFPDVTLTQLLEWERAQLAPRNEGRIIGQRIWPALFNIKTGDSQTTREIRVSEGPYRGTNFRLSTWRTDPEVIIEVPMEYDLRQNTWTNAPWP